MRIFSACLLSVTMLASALHAGEAGWTQLFNGKDLSGFKKHPDDQATWEVKEGVLHGSGPKGTLFTERGDYKNFHFRVEAKINEKGNSGQFFRAAFGPAHPAGFEAQINVTHGDRVKSGSLYPGPILKKHYTTDELEKAVVTQAPHGVDEWFTQEVIVDGHHIVIKVNGKTASEFEDSKKVFTQGHLGIQQHDPLSRIMIRKIEVKELK